MIRARWAITFLTLGCLAAPANAAWPWEGPWPWSSHEGSRRIDVIGPIGNRLPPSYRRQYNRPTYVGGKIAAKIAPSSQEAMAFHRAEEFGLYDDNGIKGALSCQHQPPQRVVQLYFYPKPWEALTVGPRRDVHAPARVDESSDDDDEPFGLEAPVQMTPADEIMELPSPAVIAE